MQHKFYCPVVTGEAEICTCGALFRADRRRPHSDGSAEVKARQWVAVVGDALALMTFRAAPFGGSADELVS